MRIQKFLIISLVVGSGVSQAFSQEAASNAQQKGKSEDFFRARKPVPVMIAAAETEDPLVELLRKKQAELDAKGATANVPSVAPAKRETPAVAPKPTPSVAQPAPVAAAVQGDERLVEVLRQKQAELDANERTGKASPVAPLRKTSPATVPKPAPIVAKPAPVAPVAPVTENSKRVVAQPKKPVSQPAVDPQSEERLVELMRKKQAELDAKAGIVAPAPAIVKPAEVEVKKPTVAAQPSKKEQQDAAARIKRIEAELKAKEEAAKKIAAKPAAPDVKASKPVAATKESKTPKSTVATKESKTSKTIPAPAPSLSPKEAKLAELLRRYKADEITPHDYHMERAKIVAQP